MAPPDLALDLCRFIDAAPSPYHAVAEAASRLEAAGFSRLDEAEPWDDAAGPRFVVRGGSLVAWIAPDAADDPIGGFRIAGAHTDSPNLRIKPQPDRLTAGYQQLGVEVYGGALLNSWLDRDLGLSGRVAVRGSGPVPDVRLFRTDGPLLRIPQLAVHLDRGVNEKGLVLNPQQHLSPIWGLGDRPADFRRFLAAEVGIDVADVVSWDVMAHDVAPSALVGLDDAFVSAPRIDNLASCHAAITALAKLANLANLAGHDAQPGTDPGAGTHTAGVVPVICLFDHEEIGSQSASGADSSMLPTLLERIATSTGLSRDGFLRALARSLCVSADGAHATHPSYADRHEPNHLITLDGGPALKVNSNVRYASDAVSAGWLRLAAERASVPLQVFVTRSDLACGSTIGPVTAARLGIPTVDVGIPQLAMHSARELCASSTPEQFTRLLSSAFTA